MVNLLLLLLTIKTIWQATRTGATALVNWLGGGGCDTSMDSSVCKTPDCKAQCWWIESNARRCYSLKSNDRKRKVHLQGALDNDSVCRRSDFESQG